MIETRPSSFAALSRSAIASAFLLFGIAAAQQANAQENMAAFAAELFARSSSDRVETIKALKARGNTDAVAALILARRFIRESEDINEALTALTGENMALTWHEWMLWQEANPQIEPFEGFEVFKADVYQRIDPNFRLFLYKDVPHEIRLEEIAWGGVPKDGIPDLRNPERIPADKAGYLNEDDLVFGISINGDARAYPLRIMDWHEMFNDVIGGVPVALAYCTLCGSGILFETAVEGFDAPLSFGTSGFLYRSNKLMYDRSTNSLWNQFTGRPVVGELTGSGIALKARPVVITSWANWKAQNPDTTVLSLNTGHQRDYSPGRPYGTYFASPDLMFPARVDNKELQAKDFVFALRSTQLDKAWRLSDFEGGKVINDVAGVADIVLIGDAATRSVRAYHRDGRTFSKGGETNTLNSDDGALWTITEEALIGPDEEQLTRLPGHIAFWFAWAGYIGEEGELAATQ